MKKGVKLTTLGGTKVFARSRLTRAAPAGLLNAQSAAFDNLALETLFGSIGLFGSVHLDETKATRFLAVGIHHDGTVVDITVLLEQTRQIRLGQTGVNASHEEVGTGVHGAFLILLSFDVLNRTTICVSLYRSPRVTTSKHDI